MSERDFLLYCLWVKVSGVDKFLWCEIINFAPLQYSYGTKLKGNPNSRWLFYINLNKFSVI